MSDYRDWKYRDSDEAFDEAIKSRVLSADASSIRYAGHFMYMGTCPERGDAFKDRNTRKYLYAQRKVTA